MPNPTKAELLAENRKLARRIAALERAKRKGAAEPADAKKLRTDLLAAEQRQAATAEILKVIAASPSDVQPAFEAIAKSAMRLLAGMSAVVTRVIGDELHLAALTSTGKAGDARLRNRYPMPLSGDSTLCMVARTGELNMRADTESRGVSASARETARVRGYRSMLAVPMLRDGAPIGTISVTRKEPGAFTTQQVGLLQTFADQAVIAIENVRLFNETKEALERQTATAEILKVISSSPTDTQPVFEAIVQSAARLFYPFGAGIVMREGDAVQLRAVAGPATANFAAVKAIYPLPYDPEEIMSARVMRDARTLEVLDMETEDLHPAIRKVSRAANFRSSTMVPLVRDGKGIGVITLTQAEPGKRLTEKQMQLLQTFADQAVIAIENVRLFNETKEALERQTATADILKVIASSPSDVQPVFDAIAESAMRLFDGQSAVVTRVIGDSLHLAAMTAGSDEGLEAIRSAFPMLLSEDRFHSRIARTGAPSFHYDLENEPDVLPKLREIARARQIRSTLAVPLLREGLSIGTLSVARRDPGHFTDHQVSLLKTFADQAVIAIENVRLFNETKESLERQTATAEILKVIASSPSDVQPVFDTIASSAMQLIEGHSAAVWRLSGGKLHLAALTSTDGSGNEALKTRPPVDLTGGNANTHAVRTGKPAFISDTENDAEVGQELREVARARGFRSVLSVPMLREGGVVGTITVTRTTSGPFADHEIGLLQTFGDQAVIAIENVRLFNETKESLERQTGTAEILRVIAASPSDVQPVFRSVAECAARLCQASDSVIVLKRGGEMVYAAHHGAIGVRPDGTTVPLSRGLASGRALVDCAQVHVLDVQSEPEEFPEACENARKAGFRTILATPMLRDGEAIGAIVIRRMEAQLFSEQHVELLKTFADQAVIAIENVRLFNETKEALERQTATAEILKVMGSSPTDTRPVFEAIATSALRVFNGKGVAIVLVDGDEIESVAEVGNVPNPQPNFRMPLTRDSTSGRAILDRAVINFPDTEAPDAPPYARANGRSRGVRSIAGAPMLRNGIGVGAIVVLGENPGGLSEKHVELLQTFADQAVIAIENVRLFNETKEALERQTATSDVLQVISSSPNDLRPVFDAVLRNATSLCDAHLGVLNLFDGEKFETVAQRGGSPEFAKWLFERGAWSPRGQASLEKMIAERRPIQVLDAADSDSYREGKPGAVKWIDVGGARTFLYVPLIRDGKVIGNIGIYRPEVRPFTDRQVELVSTFAAQAVIAIENVRLFNETKEALEQQTATAGILRVISESPTDTQPVFDAIVENALRLFDGHGVAILLADGDQVQLGSAGGIIEHQAARAKYPLPLDGKTVSGRAIVEKQVVNIADAQAAGMPEAGRDIAVTLDYHGLTAMPMLREGEAIGSISVARRSAGGLADKDLALLRTFADQAVIAIENVRLFNETKEALEQQTATAEVLQVISSSVADAAPVFDKILVGCERLFNGSQFIVFLVENDDVLRIGAIRGEDPERVEDSRRIFPRPLAGTATEQCIRERRLLTFGDVLNDPGVPEGLRRIAAELGYSYSVAIAPMLSEGRAIGSILVSREELRAFNATEQRLLQTFAEQAVIAIQNVRLFKELESRTQALSQSVGQLTALGEVGQAISSTLDLDTVLQTIVSRALQLTGLDGGSMYEYDEQAEVFRMQVSENMAEELLLVARDEPIRLGSGSVGRAGVTREPVQVPDTLDDSYQSDRKELLIRSGYRAVLAVPLLREDNLLGALLVTRKTPGPFADEVVALLKTFATQSAMAIQNARLFREIAEKGKQLEIASHHKSDFLASMSHELRTPLNAILGFNELILAEIYGTVPEEMKEPLSDIQTSGKHLLRLINNVLDLAKIEAGRMELALADYSVHDTVESVRSTLRPLAAEKGLEFVTTVPDEIPIAYGDFGRITQCLMNLAGNSLKFTKVGKVEIAVQLNEGVLVYKVNDTGIGIPPDKIGSLFTEFKQTDATIASEYGGTGLGLSISKKFIEMHGGRVWVESEVGRGSSFIFEVPLRVDASRGAQQ